MLEPRETKWDTLVLNGFTARYNIYSKEDQFQRVMDFSNSLEKALLLLRIENLEKLLNK